MIAFNDQRNQLPPSLGSLDYSNSDPSNDINECINDQDVIGTSKKVRMRNRQTQQKNESSISHFGGKSINNRQRSFRNVGSLFDPNDETSESSRAELDSAPSSVSSSVDSMNLEPILQNSQYDLKECIAPAGPLGVIVDTTPNGPLIHAIKDNSPLKGKVEPGDIIIAVDDCNTRHMTAASLTRLVGKKSQQSRRKILLLRYTKQH